MAAPDPVQPEGEPLPPVHAGVPLSEAEIDAAIEEWDRAMPEEFRGLLDAKRVP